MRFARPELLWLLLVLPVLGAGMWAVAARRRRALERFAGGAAHRARFLVEVSPHRRAAKTLLWLLAAGSVLVAAARPQWGTRLEPITRTGIDVVVAIDTSRSMAAEDVPPSRLGQATHAAASLLTRLRGNRVALVTFAGRATLICPLTVDHAAAKLFLDTIEIDSAPVPGTALAEALRVALRAFGEPDEAASRTRAVVLFTDGEDHEGEIDEALSELERAGVAVYAVGTGTGGGAPIPVKDEHGGIEGYKKDREGRVVTTRLDEEALGQVALATDGRYYRATPTEIEIEEIARSLAGLDAHEFGTVLRVRYEERYQLPLGLALAALLAEACLSDRRRQRGGGGEPGTGTAGARA
jgi:Ca-activated chloride channel family protein